MTWGAKKREYRSRTEQVTTRGGVGEIPGQNKKKELKVTTATCMHCSSANLRSNANGMMYILYYEEHEGGRRRRRGEGGGVVDGLWGGV